MQDAFDFLEDEVNTLEDSFYKIKHEVERESKMNYASIFGASLIAGLGTYKYMDQQEALTNGTLMLLSQFIALNMQEFLRESGYMYKYKQAVVVAISSLLFSVSSRQFGISDDNMWNFQLSIISSSLGEGLQYVKDNKQLYTSNDCSCE